MWIATWTDGKDRPIARETGECKYQEAIIHIQPPSCENADKDPPDGGGKCKRYLESRIWAMSYTCCHAVILVLLTSIWLTVIGPILAISHSASARWLGVIWKTKLLPNVACKALKPEREREPIFSGVLSVVCIWHEEKWRRRGLFARLNARWLLKHANQLSKLAIKSELSLRLSPGVAVRVADFHVAVSVEPENMWINTH